LSGLQIHCLNPKEGQSNHLERIESHEFVQCPLKDRIQGKVGPLHSSLTPGKKVRE